MQRTQKNIQTSLQSRDCIKNPHPGVRRMTSEDYNDEIEDISDDYLI